MAIKTITVTEAAYRVLKAGKRPNESFSELILRAGGKRSLLEFSGALSRESAEGLEKAVGEARKRRSRTHSERAKRIAKAMGG